MLFLLFNILKLILINLILEKKTFVLILLNKEKNKLVEFFTYGLILIELILLLVLLTFVLRLILLVLGLMLVLEKGFEL